MKDLEKSILPLLQYEGLGWGGGLTSFMLSEMLGKPIGPVRKTLRNLAREDKCYACAPPIYHREDGKSANTLVWFRL